MLLHRCLISHINLIDKDVIPTLMQIFNFVQKKIFSTKIRQIHLIIQDWIFSSKNWFLKWNCIFTSVCSMRISRNSKQLMTHLCNDQITMKKPWKKCLKNRSEVQFFKSIFDQLHHDLNFFKIVQNRLACFPNGHPSIIFSLFDSLFPS